MRQRLRARRRVQSARLPSAGVVGVLARLATRRGGDAQQRQGGLQVRRLVRKELDHRLPRKRGAKGGQVSGKLRRAWRAARLVAAERGEELQETRGPLRGGQVGSSARGRRARRSAQHARQRRQQRLQVRVKQLRLLLILGALRTSAEPKQSAHTRSAQRSAPMRPAATPSARSDPSSAWAAPCRPSVAARREARGGARTMAATRA